MKIFRALMRLTNIKDTAPLERLESNRVRATIEGYCEKYLKDSNDILKIEILPCALDAALSALDGQKFLEKYEFEQVSETLFNIRLRELNLLG